MKSLLFAISCLFCILSLSAQNQPDPKLTEIWGPEPKIVTPGLTPVDAPSDAIVLFRSKSLKDWVSVKDTTKEAQWTVTDNLFTVKKGTGNIQTKRKFMDYQLHIEWRIPKEISGSNQARGNSGVFLASTGPGDNGYEIQVLDCYNNKTYVNGQAGSIYKQAIPLANACKKPGEWQTYDIIWTAPRFHADGSLKSPARITAFQNGVLLVNNFELTGATVNQGIPTYKAHGASSIKLQDHGDPSAPISFRNIWVREL
jgi:hypothetical protein